MKKTILVLFLMLFSSVGFSENYKPFDVERARKSAEPIGAHIDTTKVYAMKIGELLKKEYKMWGLKKTIQVNTNVFLPIVIFLVVLLVWLKNKK